MKYFVTVGTQKHSFTRLFNYVDKYLNAKDVTTQYGYTNYNGSFKFTDDLTKYIKEADVIITHGGVGSIMEALKLNKKVIAVARLAKYMEHVDDHQLEIVNKLERDNYILSASNEEQFAQCLNKVNNHIFNVYESTTNSFNEKLNEEISKL